MPSSICKILTLEELTDPRLYLHCVRARSLFARCPLFDKTNRLPGVLDAHIPAALQLEPCADAEAKEALSSARARFLESAQSFLRPCFQEAVLDNLTRDDPLAPPKFEREFAVAGCTAVV